MGLPRFGGIPTDVDVRALRSAFGLPQVGESISYAAVADVIKAHVGSPRFRTVTNRWRSQMVREHNVYIAARDGAFTAMTAPERIDHGAAKLRTGVRAMRRAHSVVVATDRSLLTDEQRARADHLQMVTTSVIQAARLQAKAAPPVLPVGVAAANSQER